MQLLNEFKKYYLIILQYPFRKLLVTKLFKNSTVYSVEFKTNL